MLLLHLIYFYSFYYCECDWEIFRITKFIKFQIIFTMGTKYFYCSIFESNLKQFSAKLFLICLLIILHQPLSKGQSWVILNENLVVPNQLKIPWHVMKIHQNQFKQCIQRGMELKTIQGSENRISLNRINMGIWYIHISCANTHDYYSHCQSAQRK